MIGDGHLLQQGLKASSVLVVWQEKEAVNWKSELIFLPQKLGTSLLKIGVRIQYDGNELPRVSASLYLGGNPWKFRHSASDPVSIDVGNTHMFQQAPYEVFVITPLDEYHPVGNHHLISMP